MLKIEGEEDKDKDKSDSSKNEKHGDGGREMSRAEKQIAEYEAQMAGANKAQQKKLKKKIQNVRENAQRKAKGEEHSKTKKR